MNTCVHTEVHKDILNLLAVLYNIICFVRIFKKKYLKAQF